VNFLELVENTDFVDLLHELRVAFEVGHMRVVLEHMGPQGVGEAVNLVFA
jgi:hypothetical protein